MKNNGKEHSELAIEQPDIELTPRFSNQLKIAILNAPVITTFGNYTYFPIPIESAKILANASEFSSFVGHDSTAKVISELLEKPINSSRKMLKQKVGQIALVFKLKVRPLEGVILDKKQVEEHGYEFGILYRLK